MPPRWICAAGVVSVDGAGAWAKALEAAGVGAGAVTAGAGTLPSARVTDTGADAELGPDAPQVDVGALVLTSFYARMIINADGRLNLSDVVASPASTCGASGPSSASSREAVSVRQRRKSSPVSLSCTRTRSSAALPR